MKEKTDVRQGTLALMVLKTLDVLGPLHGYGIARRIEQISGDLLAVNQGTLYPVLLKLEQEGAIASELGASENNRKARFYRLTRERTQTAPGRDPGLGANGSHHRPILRGESGGSEMRDLRRFLKRLATTATRRQDEERLREEIRGTPRSANRRKPPRRLVSGGSTPPSRAEVRRGGGDKGRISGSERTAVCGNAAAGYAPRAAPAAEGPGVHHHRRPDAGAGHWRNHFDFYSGARRILKSLAVANPGELYRLGKEARCCYWGGYSQEKEFSLVSYDLYKYFRDNTKGFAELAAFSASEELFGVRRSGAADAAQSYPGEFVSGNYFTMFGIRAYAGRLLTASDDRAGAPPVAVMSYRLWQQKYGSGSLRRRRRLQSG